LGTCEEVVEQGGLGEPCYPNGTCDDTLTCDSERICSESVCQPANIVFLNRNGGTFYSGNADDSVTNTAVSLMATSVSDFEFSAWLYNDATWNSVMTTMADIFSPFDILVTDTDPGAVDHIEIVLTNDTSGSVFPGPDGYYVAASNCEGAQRPVVFVFATTVGDSAVAIATFAAKGVAITQGLDWVTDCDDIMTWDVSCSGDHFSNTDLSCGASVANDCTCGGASQNSYLMLLEKFGVNSCQ
jgi:hypothetical protein